MTLDVTKIATGIPEVTFLALQPDADTRVMPTSSGTVFLAEGAKFEQDPVIAENKEKRNTLAVQKGKSAGYKVGTFTLPINVKLSGTAGTESPISPLLTSLWGRKQVTPGTDVRYAHYQPGDDPVYLTILHKSDLETWLIRGAVVNKGTLKVVATEIQTIDLSGFFLEKLHAGTDELLSAIDGTVTPVTVVPLTHSAKAFDVGSYIVVGTDDNSGAGFEVVGKDEVANTLTIAGGVTTVQDAGSIIKGWTPVVSASGYDVVGQYGWMKLDRTGSLANVSITEATFELDNGFKALENIKANSMFPGRIGIGKRKVTLNISRHFTIEDLDVRSFVNSQTEIPAQLNVGDEAGKIIRVEIPNFVPTKTDETGNEEKTKNIQGECYEDTGHDEATLVLM